MIRRIALIAFACLLPATAVADPAQMTVGQILDIAKTIPGFSYWWGGAKWLPGAADKGKCIPQGANGCPQCSHTGAYGADCSGFVGKAWQVDKPTPLDVYYHPYSTYNFTLTEQWWTHPPKGDAKAGDAFSHHSNGAGHVFLYEKGDPWGSVYAWECKGCVYGCVYNLRSISPEYVLVRRKFINTPPQCKKHCEGTAIVDENCNKGDCAAFAAKCVDDNLGVRCVSVFCPNQGTTSTCLPDPKNGKIATCQNGALKDSGDCGAYGAICSTAVPPKAKCVSALCEGNPKATPKAGDLCYDNKRFTCNAAGDLKASPCPPGAPCQTLAGKTGPGSGVCGPKPCGNCDDSNVCTDDTCNDGICEHKPVSKACDDGDLCTASDVCSEGNCAGTPLDCDDKVACTADTCDGGKCAHNPADPECDDGNPCTADNCGAAGCTHAPKDGPCDDNDGCTVGGGCKNGECAPGTAKQCDDENTCTADSCKDGLCLHAPLDGNCDDGDGCTTGDYCANGQCLAGASKNCDDGKACTTDACLNGACNHAEDPSNTFATCDGNNVNEVGACTGKVLKTTPCGNGTVCVAGVCKPASQAGGQDATGDAAVGAAKDTVATAPAATSQSNGLFSSCRAANAPLPNGLLTALGLLALAAGWTVRRRRPD